MPSSRIALRMALAFAAFAAVSLTMLVVLTNVALAIDWNIPEAAPELLGPSSVFDRNGVPLARFAAEVEHREVPLAAIGEHLQDAVVATEDHRFYEHQGVDPFSVLRAVVRNVQTGSIVQGGSTLTQQYVKNVYVGSELTLWRKIREALISLQLEKERSKDEILEAYLNRTYFGDGAYGAEAAARTYFGKPASDLTLAEAALLASVLSAPSELSPRVDPVGALRRRNDVLDEMVRYDFVDAGTAEAAKNEPLGVIEQERTIPFAPYFVEEVRRQVLAAYGPERVYNGGLVITTTLDVARQQALEAAVIPLLPPNPAFEPGIAVVDPRNGDIVAAWSGRNFLESQVDLALNEQFGRPSGSTFKVFALATALEEGKELTTTYRAPGSININGYRVTGGGCGGRCSLLEATVRSINVVFAQLGRDVGIADFTTMAHRLGVLSPLNPETNLSQVLGTASVTPLDMASAFGTFANDGVACPARAVLSVTTPDGGTLPPPDPRQPNAEERAAWQARLESQGYDLGEENLGRCYRAIAPSVARTVTVALQQVVARGTGQAAQIDRPQAGKTGTTDDYRQAWFVGYTPNTSMAVSLAALGAQVPLRNIPGCGEVCFGGELPAMIWHDAALAVLQDVPPAEFPQLIEDERVSPDRRRLGPPAPPRPPPPPPPTAPTFSPSPTPRHTGPPITLPPPPDDDPARPPPDDGDGDGDGILEPVLPG